MKPPGVCVPLLVPDFDRAIEFYCRETDLFDLDCDGRFGSEWNRNTRLRYKHPSHPFTIKLEYIEPAALVRVQDLVASHSSYTCAFVLPVGHCHETHFLMTRRGVVFDGDVLDLPWGVQAKFRDPFGHLIVLLEDYSYMSHD